MSTLSSAKLLARVVVLRRQVLLRQLVRRTIAGALAVAALIVTTGLATYALFLTIRIPLGDLEATLVVASIYLVTAVILLIYVLWEPASPELEALAEVEAAVLETATADSQDVVHMFSAAGHRIEDLGNSLTLGVGMLSALRKLLASRKS